MNRITMLALAGAASAAFTSGSALAQDTSYQTLKDQAAAAYKSALSQCESATGNAKKICVQEGKVARAHAEADAVAQHKNTPSELGRARSALANAEYDLAKVKCGDMSGSSKTSCMHDAKSAQSTALADAKAGTQHGDAAGRGDSQSERSPGMASTGATGVAMTGAGMNDDQRSAGANTTRESCDQAEATEKAACLARNTTGAAKNVVADTVITTKLKTDLVRDPDLKAMDVHVETVKGVVMLSGFVPSKAQAEKAEKLARGIDGVTDVKSAIKVATSEE